MEHWLEVFSLSLLTGYNPKMLFQFLSFLIVFPFIHQTSAEENPRIVVCDSSNNYTLGSAFSTNLGVALKTLQNNTAPTGFSFTAISPTNSSQPVTALALCRATITPAECQECMDSAVLSIRRVCPNQTTAQIWHTYCMIRYSSRNFINKTDISNAFDLYDTREVSNPIIYDQTVRTFTEELASLAGRSGKRFAVAKTKVITSDVFLYGYVECTRDVDGESCTECLLSVRSYMIGCCSGKWAIWGGAPTCSVQVNLDPVHKDWETAIDINALLEPATAPESEPEADRESGGSRKVIMGTVAGVAGAVISIGVGVLCVVKIRKGRSKQFEGEYADDESSNNEGILIDLDVLIAATDNFSIANMLGRGGFGTVFKGRMLDGREIAVKKLASNSIQGKEEFENEVRVLLKMHHRNLVQLFGCCAQETERILVYEYLPNSSLDNYLFDKSKSAILDWPKRSNIIMGVARGLVYLHQDSALRIIHRDIKASNILLDREMNPKISDFGLAKLFHDEQSRHRTRQIAGTFGYMAPEYAIRGVVSMKSDVFSFGVLLLEIISGRKTYDRQFEAERQELLKLARRLEEEGRLMELVDVTIGSFPEEIALRFMQIALLCTEDFVEDRPTMSAALAMLSNNSVTIPAAPEPPEYQDDDDDGDDGDYNGASNAGRRQEFSRNSITITLLDGR